MLVFGAAAAAVEIGAGEVVEILLDAGGADGWVGRLVRRIQE